MSYNRWLYTYSNAVNYTDPSGHVPCSLLPPSDRIDAGCPTPPPPTSFNLIKLEYGLSHNENGITINPREWTRAEQIVAADAALQVGRAMAQVINRELARRYTESIVDCSGPNSFLPPPARIDPIKAFLSVYGGRVSFVRKSETSTFAYYGDSNRDIQDGDGNNVPDGVPDADGVWAETKTANEIRVWANATESRVVHNPRWIVHELAHAFENATMITNTKPGRRELARHADLMNRDDGFAGGRGVWQYSGDLGSGEIFADMFVGWVYNRWETDRDNNLTAAGLARQNFMNVNMPAWIMLAYDRNHYKAYSR